MKKRFIISPLHRAALASAALLLLFPACGKDNPSDPGAALCGGDSGFGARVIGRADPVDVCVADDKVTTFLTIEDNYSVHAAMTAGGVTFDFELLFHHRDDFPVAMTLHDDIGAALADEFGVYILYQETPAQGEALESYQVTGGTFNLGFTQSDRSVVTAEMNNVTLRMRTTGSNPEDRGTRSIEKGFLTLNVDG
jgi:hypothetical protein